MDVNLYAEIRKKENLFSAWRHVRRSSLQSKENKIRGQAGQFEHKFHTHFTRIQNQLRERRYVFDKSIGILGDQKKRQLQDKEPRPIVLSSIESRVVQRAILQVLQPKKIKCWVDEKPIFEVSTDVRLGRINEVNTSKFGVGGLARPYGGVERAIFFVDDAMKAGCKYYYQTDIKSFFTKIPTDRVMSFLRSEIADQDFCDLFEQAMNVELSNPEELGNYEKLFPHNGEGVAQGSSLSAFAGNVLLYDFDQKLNELNVSAIRYIDDIFVLTKNEIDREAAEKFCNSELGSMGLSVYPVSTEKNSKARRGNVNDGFDLLGCTIFPNSIAPSRNAQNNLLDKIDSKISRSKRDIKSIYNGKLSNGSKHNFSETLCTIGKQIYGWQKSFSFCNNIVAFENLDKKIETKIVEYTYFSDRLKGKFKERKSSVVSTLGIPATTKLYENSKK